jgi:DNA polymerase III subunit gamma/tau
VTLGNSATAPTILEARNAAEDAMQAEAKEHPLVQAVFAAFPKARISQVKTVQDITSHAEAEALPEVEEEWDPFEED